METIYIKRQAKQGEPSAFLFVVPAVGIRAKEGMRLIPHPYGTETTTFESLELAVEQVHRAGYAAEFDGKHFPLPPRQNTRPTRSASIGVKNNMPLASLMNEALPFLHNQLNDNSPAVIATALQALGEMRDESCLTGILHSLGNEDASVRKHAAEALAQIGRPALTGIRMALQDKHWLVRHTALAAIIELVHRQLDLVPEVLQETLPMLKDDSWLVRSQAAVVYAELAKALSTRDVQDR